MFHFPKLSQGCSLVFTKHNIIRDVLIQSQRSVSGLIKAFFNLSGSALLSRNLGLILCFTSGATRSGCRVLQLWSFTIDMLLWHLFSFKTHNMHMQRTVATSIKPSPPTRDRSFLFCARKAETCAQHCPCSPDKLSFETLEVGIVTDAK